MSAPAYSPPPQGKPTTSTVQPVAPPQVDDSTAAAIVEILLAGYAALKTAQLVKALLGASTGLPAVEAALGLAKHAHSARPQLARFSIERNSPAAEIARRTANQDVYFRAAYVVKAAQRIQAKIDSGASVRDAVRAEKPNYEAHRAARDNRLEVAANVGTSAMMFGPLLGWYRNAALDSDTDCIAADGHNFYADSIPIIGLPGSVHPNCGCRPGPPHEGAGLVDEAVASLLRRPAVRRQPRTGTDEYRIAS
jgi:hypothetical protein